MVTAFKKNLNSELLFFWDFNQTEAATVNNLSTSFYIQLYLWVK